MPRYSFLLFFIISAFFSFSQEINDIKILNDKISVAKEDTTKIRLLYQLSILYRKGKQHENEGKVNNRALLLSQKLQFKPGIITAYKFEGERLALLSQNNEAIKEFEKCLSYMKAKDKSNYQYVCSKLGRLYFLIGNYPSSLQYMLEALKTAELLKDDASVGKYSGNIGNIYSQINEQEKALDYYLKALTIAQKCNNTQSIATNKVQIGGVFFHQNEYDKAFEFYMDALKINEEIQKTYFLANNYLVLAQCEIKRKHLTEANSYLTKAKALAIKSQDYEMLSSINIELSKLMIEKANYLEAEKYALEGLEIARKYNFVESRLSTLYYLADINDSLKDYKDAFFYFAEYTDLNDSLNNMEFKKTILEKEISYEYEKKEVLAKAEFEKQQALNKIELQRRKQALQLLEQNNLLNELQLNQSTILLKQNQVESKANKRKLSLLKKEKLLQESYSREKSKELARQRFIRNWFVFGAIVFLFMALFIFRSLKKSKAQNQLIEEQKLIVEQQKQLVEAHNTEIVDSITYAKRIQHAILPSLESISNAFPNSFVYYQPKDIVAGDFYWMEKAGDLLFLAVADSTGHGVPGALVSVVCSNALNRSVLEFDLTEPGEVLDKTREIVLETFSKNGEEIKDGMDISLCVFNQKNACVKWSGANNPLWYIQAGELKEIKPNKQAIGKVDNPEPFTTHTISIDQETQFYLFTDGYADQFGGEKGKKFMYKQFKELLVSTHQTPSAFQKHMLQDTFNDWKRHHEQVDDICVIGIRI